MSTNDTTRRKALQALGATGLTCLAGCASMLEEEEPETITENHSENPGNNTENNTENRPEETEEPRETGEEASTVYTWQDILDAEQQFYEFAVDPIYRNTARSLSNGNVPDTTSNPSDWNVEGSDISYTHGGQKFDIDHFADASYEEALQDLSTLMFLRAVERNNGNPGISGMTRQIGLASERVFENLRDQELRYSKVNNDSHGFWGVVLSPRKDPYTVDTTSDRLDKTWEDPLQDRSGISPITNFDESKIGRENANQLDFTHKYQNMITRLSDQPSSEGGASVNKPLIADANNNFSTEGSEFHRIVPAIAVLNYQKQIEPEKYHVLRAGSWDEFPEFRPEQDDFQEYREEIESFITKLDEDNLEEYQEFKYGEKI